MTDQAKSRFTIDWAHSVDVLKAGWKILAAAFLVSLLLGFGVARLLPLQYTATMIVTAARYTSDTKPMGTSSLIVSPFAADEGQLSDFALYLKLFSSQLVAERIFKDHPELVHKIFANQWKDNHWVPPAGLKQTMRTVFYRMVGAKAWTPPSALDLAGFLSSVNAEPDRRSPVAVVSIKLGDRQMALNVLTILHDETENVLKSEATARSSIKAEFLERMAATSHGVDVSQTVGQAQVRNEISAAVSRAPVPFAAEYISPPYASPLPDQQGRVYAPITMAILGTLLAAALLILMDMYPLANFWNTLRRRD